MSTGRILPFGPSLAQSQEPLPPPDGRRRGEPDAAPLTPQEQQRFRTLVLPHMDAAYSFARFLCRDGHLAEDLVQDAFLRAFKGFAGFRGGDPRAWLFAIVRSSHLTWARGKGMRLADGPEALNQALDQTPAEDDSPEAALVRQGEVATVRFAISALPEPFRETLVLRELEELSYREIAEVTQAPIGTVMSRLARARQMLVAALGPEDQGPGEPPR